MRNCWNAVGMTAAVIVLVALGGLGIVYSGLYDVGADSPHTRPVYWLLDTLRDRSVAAHAKDVSAPPDLTDARRIARGAGLYAEMCSSCHLAPGMERTEIARGLYPQAPELAKGDDLTAPEQFWVIKHGIKATGMAAWGKTHDDALIWDMVAFISKMPSLSAAQYRELIRSAPEDHDEMMAREQTKPNE